MTVTAQSMADLQKATQRHLGRLRFNQIAQDLTDYEVFPHWFRKDKVLFDSGTGISRDHMMRFDESAAGYVGLMDEDWSSITELMETEQIDWRHARTSYSLVYQTDLLMNSGEALLYNVLKPRRISALLALVKTLETGAFRSPPSATNKVLPFGIQYWITRSATRGFNGMNPTGHNDKGGIDCTAHENWRNYTDTYSAISKKGLIACMRRAKKKTGFRSPIPVKDHRNGQVDKYRIYMPLDLTLQLDEIGESQNSNLGRDLASMDGQLYFHRHPIIDIPYLESDTTMPVYFIDHSTFYPVILTGDYLRENPPIQNGQKHNVWTTYIDLTHNYLCCDPRRSAALYYVSA